MTATMVAHDIRRVAVEAMVDPRTVERYLDGKALRGLTRERIRRAMQSLGYEAACST